MASGPWRRLPPWLVHWKESNSPVPCWAAAEKGRELQRAPSSQPRCQTGARDRWSWSQSILVCLLSSRVPSAESQTHRFMGKSCHMDSAPSCDQARNLWVPSKGTWQPKQPWASQCPAYNWDLILLQLSAPTLGQQSCQHLNHRQVGSASVLRGVKRDSLYPQETDKRQKKLGLLDNSSQISGDFFSFLVILFLVLN